ncbi:unnamed protein product [Prunus armeniaca]
MPKFASTMPSYLTVSAKEITCGTMMSWKLADDEKATLVMVHLFPSPIATRTQATSLWGRNVSPLRKKPKLSSAEKTQVVAVPRSSARRSWSYVRSHEVVRARSSSPVERQRDADVPLRSWGRLHQPKNGGRSRRSAHPSNHHDPAVESRAVKRRVDSSSPIPLEVRLAEARKAREPFAWAKGSFATSAADPKVDKSALQRM